MIGLDSVASERLCLTLLHSLWQVALLALAAWGISRCLGRRRDDAFYIVHASALVLGLITAPTTYAFLTYGGSTPTAPASQSVTAVDSNSLDPAPVASRLPPDLAIAVEAGTPTHVTSPAVQSIPIVPAASSVVWQSAMPWLAGTYFAGVVFMLARLAWSALLLERLRATAQPITNGPVFKALASICSRWSVKTAPVLAHAEQVVVPKVVGLLKPTILLPSSALTGLPIDDLELILAHELAHVRRHDLWINLLQRLAEAVLFFNPAMWWLSRRVSVLREYCCDDRACAVVPDSAESQLRYAQALLHAVELQRTGSSEQLAALAATGRSPSELRRRVARLFGEQMGDSIRLSRGGVAVLLAGVMLLLIPPTVADSSAADELQPEVSSESNDDLAGASSETDADRVVAGARARTFGLQDVPKTAFLQVYRQAEVPGMQSYRDDDIASLWKARGSQIADAVFDRSRHETKLAWDDRRLLLDSFSRFRPNESWRQTHYWDGKEGWLGEASETKEGTTKNVYRYANIDKLTDHIMPFYYPQWAAAGDRLPWPGPTVLLEEHAPDPSLTGYRPAGTDTIDGTACDVYDGPARHEKIWIEKKFGYLKAASRHYVGGDQMSEAEFLETIETITGKEDFGAQAYQEWFKQLSAEERSQVEAKWSSLTWEYAQPGSLSVFSDYREITPGVKWPHKVERIVVHPNHRGDDTFNYSLARITVEHLLEFDIDKFSRNALPEPGGEVTDRREGLNEFKYKWSLNLDEAAIDKLRDGKLAEVRAKEEEEERVNATPIDSVNDAIQILTEGPKTDPTRVWARAIKYLTDHPEPALLALIETIDGEDRDHPISKLAFALRALGDARGVPALIRAFPRTLQASRSDYGLNLDDKELCRFMQQHDGNGKARPASNLFDYGRAFREVVFSLRRLTGQQFNEMELNWIHLKGTEPQRRLARQQFERVAKTWADWWEANWRDHVEDAAYSEVGRSKAFQPEQRPVIASRPPSGPHVELIGVSSGTFQSVHNGSGSCFIDLDTRRELGWPDELPALGKTRLDSPELLAWARREGVDLVGITHTPAGEEEPLYCLMPLDLRAWKITEQEHRTLPDMVHGKKPYPLSRPADLLVPRREVPKPRDPKHSGDSFLFVTREGTAGVMRLTAQVTEGKDISGYLLSEDEQFEGKGFYRGVKYDLDTMSEPAIAESTAGTDASVGSFLEEANTDLREMRIRILNEEGDPIPGAKLYVNALRPPGYDGKRSANQDVVADSKGLIVLSIPRRVILLRLWSQSPEYVAEFMNYDLGLHQEGELIPHELEFQLAKGKSIGGTVVDESGQPVAGVRVRVKANIDEPAWSVTTEPMISTWLTDSFNQPSITTDSEGRWSLDNAPPAMDDDDQFVLLLKLDHPGYTSDSDWGGLQRTQRVTGTKLRSGNSTIVMPRGTRVEGTVTDTEGNPVTKGWVVWHDGPYFTDGVWESELDDRGTFETPQLSPGEHPISIIAPGYAAQRRVIPVAPGMNSLRFELRAGKRIELRFVDSDGNPIPKAGVYLGASSNSGTWNGSNALHSQGSPGVNYGVPRRADESGVFVWDWAPEEPVTYNVGARGYAGQEVTLVAKSEPHVIALADARVAFGKVTDASTGQPIQKFQAMPVITFRPNFFSTRYSDVKLGVDGLYELPLTGSADPDDRYRVRIEAEGYRSIVSEESFGPTDGRAELSIKLESAPMREGRVIDVEGKPITGAAVLEGTPTWAPSIYNGKPDSYGERVIRTDSEGRFSLNATTETVRVRVLHDKGIAERLLDPADESVGDMPLQPWAKVSGRLLQNGQPVGSQRIYFNRVVPRGLGEARFQGNSQSVTAADGTFSFPRLPPGTGNLRVALGPWEDSPLTSAENTPMVLEPGEKRDVVLGSEGAVISGRVITTGRDEAPLDRNWSLNYLVSRDPGPTGDLPADFPELSFDPSGPMQAAWLLDPHFSSWIATRRNHFVKLTPDGDLRVTGVAPGEYDLVIRLYEQPAGCLVETVGEKIVAVRVDGDGAIDLGQIEVPCRVGPRVGSDMRAYEFVDTTGRKRTINDMTGRYVVLHVWATWCGPCLASMPELAAVVDQLDGKPVTFVGLNIDSDRDGARGLAERRGWGWAHNYLGGNSDMARQLAISSVPTYYVVGHNGRLVAASAEWKSIQKTVVDALQPRVSQR